MEGRSLLQMNSCWVLSMLEKVAKKALVPCKSQIILTEYPDIKNKAVSLQQTEYRDLIF